MLQIRIPLRMTSEHSGGSSIRGSPPRAREGIESTYITIDDDIQFRYNTGEREDRSSRLSQQNSVIGVGEPESPLLWGGSPIRSRGASPEDPERGRSERFPREVEAGNGYQDPFRLPPVHLGPQNPGWAQSWRARCNESVVHPAGRIPASKGWNPL